MFGDNLSLISDTTIAACNGQGCPMSAKFKGNIMIALPAAIAALVMIFLFSEGEGARQIKHEYDLLMIVPYVLVLAGGVAGINVFLVLLAGIVSGAAIAIGTGSVVPAPGQNVFSQLLGNIGGNMSGMFETCIVVVLVSAMCALIREHGGFDAILYYIRRLFRGRRGGQLGIGIMVAALDIATANNTVAIVMSNPIAKELSEEYGIEPSRTACLLDTFSCITQGVIPYGAQLLVAIAAAAEMDYTVSAFRLIPLLFYPMFLLVSSLIAIAVSGRKKAA